jgi:hypothetical protein
MSTYKCPKGHESTESDYCSECGTKINGTPELALSKNPVTATVPQTTKAVVNCPDCTAPHEPDSGDFCEICGYNFVTGAHGEVPPVAVSEAMAKSIAPTPALETTLRTEGERESVSSFPPSPPHPLSLEVIVTIDPSLREEGSPDPPTNQSPITFRLDKESNLIGRSSEVRGIHPEVALDFDDAVSHRHALLNRQPDGTFIVRDIGSTNGTKLNGVELAAMVDTPIQDGDELTLGHWTRIKVKAQ